MLKFLVGFKDKSELRKIWKASFSQGTAFIPTKKPFLVQSNFNLVFWVVDTKIGAVVPSRVIQNLNGGTDETTGMVIQFKNFSSYKTKLNELIENPDEQYWHDLQNFNSFVETDAKSPQTPTALPLSVQSFFKKDYLNQNYYEMLNVEQDASREEIEESYIDLIRQILPHQYQGKVSDQELQNLQEVHQKICLAYDTLKDQKKRMAYDLSLGLEKRSHEKSKQKLKDEKVKIIRKKALEKKEETLNKAQRLVEGAQLAEGSGNLEGAITNLRIAMVYDPKNKAYQKKLEELEKAHGGHEKQPKSQEEILKGIDKSILRGKKLDWTQ